MKKIKMLDSTTGSQNGINIQLFEKNKTYTISDRLADVFCGLKKAEIIVEEEKVLSLEEAIEEMEKEEVVKEIVPEEKAMVCAPENKMTAPVKNKIKKKKKKIK